MNAKIAAILGALIGDAATLGLHWIYDPKRISEIEEQKGLVFLKPDASHYQKVKGYFAHDGKESGESSGYGEVCLLMLNHFVINGSYKRIMYQTEYRSFFGPGGVYRGYIDSPTQEILQTLLPLDPEEFPVVSGANDDQFLSLAALPAIVAFNIDPLEILLNRVEEIVRVTNNNDIAVAAAKCSAAALFEILCGKQIEEALNNSLQFAGNKLGLLLEEALAIQTLDSINVAERFGFACHVTEGLPVIFHIAKCAPDYRTAIETNIRTGGDSCGRAIMLGSFTAAHMAKQNETSFPVPLEWLVKYKNIITAAEVCTKF